MRISGHGWQLKSVNLLKLRFKGGGSKPCTSLSPQAHWQLCAPLPAAGSGGRGALGLRSEPGSQQGHRAGFAVVLFCSFEAPRTRRRSPWGAPPLLTAQVRPWLRAHPTHLTQVSSSSCPSPPGPSGSGNGEQPHTSTEGGHGLAEPPPRVTASCQAGSGAALTQLRPRVPSSHGADSCLLGRGCVRSADVE